MIDFGFEKIALIGAVALIVIGPEKLPRVARTVGMLLGKAQRYVADVKAEVNRSIELEELQKMKSQFETARCVTRTTRCARKSTRRAPRSRRRRLPVRRRRRRGRDAVPTTARTTHWPKSYKPPKKNWRLKRAAVPAWYKQRNGVRTHAQSGAARVARFRPRQGGGSPL